MAEKMIEMTLQRWADWNITSIDLQLIPARKESWYSRISFFSRHRDELKAQIEALIEKYFDHWAVGTSVDSTPSPMREGKIKEAADIIASISGYDTRTLELLVEHFTEGDNFNGIVPVLTKYIAYSECIVREAVSYAGHLRHMTIQERANAFHDLRASHSIFAREDMSELTGQERRLAEAALSYSTAMLKREKSILDHQPHSNLFMSYLTPEISNLIIRYPDRVQDMVEYASSVNGSVHAERMREYLDSGVAPLATGIL